MKRISVILSMLLILMPICGNTEAATGQYWPKGYIEKVDFLKMELVVDGEVVSINPNTKVVMFNRKQASIIDLDKGMFASVSAMKRGNQVSALRIDTINPKLIKSLTGTIVSAENDSIVMGNGLRIHVENGAKLAGLDFARPDAVVRVKGFIEKQAIRVWKIEPLYPDNPSFEITARLTGMTDKHITVDGNIKISRSQDEHFLDESGKTISESDIPVGRIVKVLCSSSQGLIRSINTQRFGRIRITFQSGSKTVVINEKKLELKHEADDDTFGFYVPCEELLRYCGVKLSFSKDKSIMYAGFEDCITVCNFKTGLVTRDSISFAFPKIRQKFEDETIVSIYAFALCLGGNPPFTFPVNMRTHTVSRD